MGFAQTLVGKVMIEIWKEIALQDRSDVAVDY